MPILIKGRGVQHLQRKKQNFIQGAFILMLASLLVKVIGAFFQIPLLNMIAGESLPPIMLSSGIWKNAPITLTSRLASIKMNAP